MPNKFDIDKVKTLAKFIRKKSIEMCHLGQSSHIGSVLSCADILAILYSIIKEEHISRIDSHCILFICHH